MIVKNIRIEDIKYPEGNECLVEPELLESIIRNGIVMPLLIREDGTIINGHMIYFAAIEAGLTEIPCCILSKTDEEAMKRWELNAAEMVFGGNLKFIFTN